MVKGRIDYALVDALRVGVLPLLLEQGLFERDLRELLEGERLDF